jgi:hypothetical protein
MRPEIQINAAGKCGALSLRRDKLAIDDQDFDVD